MPTEPSVRFGIKNELLGDKLKAPPMAGSNYHCNLNYSSWFTSCDIFILDDDEFDEDAEIDEIDGEFTPLNKGIDDGFLSPRRDSDTPSRKPNPDRRLVPAGYYPQWPTYYPEVSFRLTHSSSY